jgi:hypothetical protein
MALPSGWIGRRPRCDADNMVTKQVEGGCRSGYCHCPGRMGTGLACSHRARSACRQQGAARSNTGLKTELCKTLAARHAFVAGAGPAHLRELDDGQRLVLQVLLRMRAQRELGDLLAPHRLVRPLALAEQHEAHDARDQLVRLLRRSPAAVRPASVCCSNGTA